MPRNHVQVPGSSAPTDRLTMGVTCVRTGASTSNVYNILCACSADDAAEVSSL